jgi:minor extracellular protease Epr
MNAGTVLAVLASMLTAPSAMAQSSVPLPPSQNQTVTATPPPPPPKKRANPPPTDPDSTVPSRPRREPRPDVPEPRVDDSEDATDSTTRAPRAPGGAQIAQRPQTTAGSALRRELLVASTDVAEADLQRAWLASRGAQLLRRRTLNNLGWVLSVFRLPPEAVPATLSAELIARWPSAIPEINQRYDALGTASTVAPAEYARTLIAWPQSCATAVRIAMLDGPVNTGLARLTDRRISVTQIASAGAEPDYHHGTALAALLVAKDAPRGLLPDAELAVGVIMSTDDDGPYTTTEWVLRGLDWVLGLEPRPLALNLSFGGPRSAQMQRALEAVTRVLPVAAAAGNEGRKEVAYPASYPGVIAVTAVDARGRRWSRANVGSEVAIAAPGVQVWTLDGAGRGHYANGTSIATLFVTAALASAPPAPHALDDWLASHAIEAGPAGRDLEYGHGLLAMGAGCQRTQT